MTTLEIISEVTNNKTIYRAICGTLQATGLTPGQALDSTLQSLSSVKDTVVILQQFHPDDLFTQKQQTRLIELMGHFQESIVTGNPLSTVEQQELENLVEAELEAAISRSTRIVEQTQPPRLEGEK